MRKIGWFATSTALVLMAVAFVEGQQGEKKKTGGGGGGGAAGGFGGFGVQRQDPLALLNNQQVKKELALTDEQLQKLPAEVLAAIAKVLDEKQMKRFRQIELQQRGNDAFKDLAVQKALSITSEQKTKIVSVLDESSKELAELNKGGFGGGGGGADFKARTEKRETIRKETTEKINTVLTTEQRKAWTEMLGEELKLQRGFGGAGGAGGTFNKKGAKKDTE